MKGTSRPSTELFFIQALPTISFQHFSNRKIRKEKVIRLLWRHREIMGQCFMITGIATLLLAGTYLFCTQLAKYGW